MFREDVDIVPTVVDDSLSYIPWGGDNQMPFDLLALVEKDETLATCQCFNAEVCYGSGLQYCATEASASVKSAVEDFTLENDIAAYFLGICQDFKHFGFAVSVLILNEDGTKIVRLLRKEACYCRFTPADSHGRISKILYANWHKSISSRADIEEIDLLDQTSPWRDLQDKLAKKSRVRKFAIVSRIPRLTAPIIPFLIMVHCSGASGTKKLNLRPRKNSVFQTQRPSSSNKSLILHLPVEPTVLTTALNVAIYVCNYVCKFL